VWSVSSSNDVGRAVVVIPSLDPSSTVSDHILTAVLALLKKEVSEHGRHIAQYFHLFLSYSNLGISEVRLQIFHSLVAVVVW